MGLHGGFVALMCVFLGLCLLGIKFIFGSKVDMAD
jgi:hypothetical protein